MFIDIEGGYTADGVNYANGWNEWVYSSGTDCGEIISSEDIPPAIDRGVVNGFETCIDGQTLTSAVYSSPDYWAETFGTCSSSNRPACLTETPEWTSEGDSGCALPGPHGWARALVSVVRNRARFSVMLAALTSSDGNGVKPVVLTTIATSTISRTPISISPMPPTGRLADEET